MKNEENKGFLSHLVITNDTKEPSLYQVFVHNDDFTPMEFVVEILEKFFYMDRTKAAATMLEAHLNGRAACGMFSRDIADTKINQVVDYARLHEYPLVCSLEAA